MAKNIKVDLLPVFSNDDISATDKPYRDIHSYLQELRKYRPCNAVLMKIANSWQDSFLKIEWNSEEKYFDVSFKGEGKIDISLQEALSQRIPLEIANTSRCSCGSPLTLGDYKIEFKSSDFTFEGNYYCSVCKEESIAKQSGFKAIIQRWFMGLKKIEIKASGLGIERS